MKNKKILSVAILFGLFFGTINILFNPAPCDDAVRYYIPMARAFGAGDYTHAFHHTIPPLVPAIGGVLVALGFSAWAAIKTVAVAAWILAVFPLYRIARRILRSDLYAQWCCLGYVLLFELMQCAFSGALEPMKMLLLFWVVDCLMACNENGRLRDVAYAGAGVALLGLVRNECIAFVLPVLALVLLMKKYPFWKRIAAVTVILGTCLALWSPFALLIQKEFGIPALTSKQVKSVQGLIKIMHLPSAQAPGHADQKLDPSAVSFQMPEEVQDVPRRKSLGGRIENTLRGAFPLLMPFWIYGIFLRRRRHEWSFNDALCLIFFGYNALIFWVFVDYTVPRYIEAVAPLLLPWALLGLTEAGRIVALRVPAVKRVNRCWISAVLAVAVVGAGIKGSGGVRHFLKGDYDTRIEVGRWIKKNASRLDVNTTPDPNKGFGRADYSSGQPFSIAAYTPGYSQWACADFISMRWNYPPVQQDFLRYLKSQGADVLILDEAVRKNCRAAEEEVIKLRLLKDFPEYKVTVYSLDLSRLPPEK